MTETESPSSVVPPEEEQSETQPQPPSPDPDEAPKDVAEEKSVIPIMPPPDNNLDDSKALVLVESMILINHYPLLSFFH